MIKVFFTRFDSRLPPALSDACRRRLPTALGDAIARYRRWQDRHSRLFAYLLLLKGLRQYGYPPDSLERLRYTAYGRPFLDNGIDFNISHSGAYAACALSDHGRIGLDIEAIRPIRLADFKGQMTPAEWERLTGSLEAPYDCFYTYWTIKESVIKAHGKGLSIPLPDVAVNDDGTAVLYGETWFIEPLDIDCEYKCHLAATEKTTNIKLVNCSAIDLPGK